MHRLDFLKGMGASSAGGRCFALVAGRKRGPNFASSMRMIMAICCFDPVIRTSN